MMKAATAPARSTFLYAERRYETSTLVSTSFSDVFLRWLRRTRHILWRRAATAAGARRGFWICTGTGLCVDRRFLGLARTLCLGSRLLGAAAASARCVGSRPRVLQSWPVFVSPRALAVAPAFESLQSTQRDRGPAHTNNYCPLTSALELQCGACRLS